MVVRPIEGPPSEYEERKLAKTSPNRANLPCCLKHIESNPCVNRWAVEWANWEFVPTGGVFPRVRAGKKCPRPWDGRRIREKEPLTFGRSFHCSITDPPPGWVLKKAARGFHARGDI